MLWGGVLCEFSSFWFGGCKVLVADGCRMHMMITDTTGKTGMMFGEQPGRGVELGDAVRRASEELVRVIEE